MTRGFVWLLLAISVLFNVFFLAGFLKARAAVDTGVEGAASVDRVAEVLNLDGTQTETFGRLRSAMREDERVVREAMSVNRRELAEELARETPDIERVRELATDQADLHRRRREAGAERFSDFMGVLTPEQCARLGRELHRGRKRFGPPPVDPLQYDADGDGVLNEQEEETFRAERKAEIERHLDRMERTHEERKRRREEFRRRFDADGDGHLDDVERAALREFMQTQRPRGRRRPPRNGERGGRPPLGPGAPRPD
jgi:hypothetical protein